MNEFNYFLKTYAEFGVVSEISYPIVSVEGLPSAKLSELVYFQTGQVGQIYTIGQEVMEVLLFSQIPVKVGTKVVSSKKRLTVPVGEELLGKIINPLGEPVSKVYEFKKPKLDREIEQKPLPISKRSRIKKPFRTGMNLVDMLIPIGKGQKQLIIGDRQTGKSGFLQTSIKTQIQEGAVAVYAAIARKKSYIKNVENFFKKEKLMDNLVLVVTSSHDPPSLTYLNPYTAMTIAEYFRDLGRDVILVLDDLSSHAKFYREISLLAKRFPGRESYPGDIFYTHARLLERAGNFKHPKVGEVAITCFPVAEVVEGDLTAYIPTNLIGITDGHLFFDTNMYYNGRRPAINASLSVTRVGQQTQSSLKKTITRELISFFSLFEKMQTYSHFGAELSSTVKDVLQTGERIYKFFDQTYHEIIPEEIQLILFALIWIKILDIQDDQQLYNIRLQMLKSYQTRAGKALFDQILNVDSLNGLLGQVTKNKDQLFAIWNKKIN